MLNEKQQEIVNDENNLVVIAGPGSGKTYTITQKIDKVLKVLSHKEVLLLTFTNSAANEMKERMELSETRTFGTFHSIFLKLLVDYNILNEYFDNVPVITMDNDVVRYIRNRLKTYIETNIPEFLDILELEGNFTNKFFDNNIMYLNDIINGINSSINNLTVQDIKNRTLKQVYNNLIDNIISEALKEIENSILLKNVESDGYIPAKTQLKIIKEIIPEKYYQEIFSELKKIFIDVKFKNLNINFSDILLITLFALSKNTIFRKKINNLFKFIAVDEYQDTNIIENEILFLLKNENNKICVIGDPYQSIFAFIGANIDNILNAPVNFNAVQKQLILNYRSSKNIVSLTNYFAEKMVEKVNNWQPCKNVITENEKIYVETNVEDVTSNILNIVLDIPINRTVGILARSGNTYKLEMLFKSNNIPYNKLGGKKLVEAIEIQLLVNYFYLLMNLNNTVALSKVLEIIPKVGIKSIEKFITYVNSGKDMFLYENKEIREFVKQLDKLKLTEENLKKIKFKEKVINFFFKNIFSYISENWRLQRIEEAKLKIDIFYKEFLKVENIDTFKELIDEYILADDTKRNKKERITISTIHSAKGLEWDEVILYDWNIDTFRRDKISESQRLNYIAVSRAKKKLYMLSSTNYIFQLDKNFIIEHPEIFETLENKENKELKIKFGKHKGKQFNELPFGYLKWLNENKADMIKRELLNEEETLYIEELLEY